MIQQDLDQTTPAGTEAPPRLRFTHKPTTEKPVTPEPLEAVTEAEVPFDEYDYYDDYYYYDDELLDSPTPFDAAEVQPQDTKSETVAEPTSPTVTHTQPRFVRPTPFDITTSSFDIIEALKRERTYTKFVAPTRSGEPRPRTTATTTTQTETEPPTEEILPSNVVYNTFATTTLLPILGGRQSITLTIMTSTLTTLAEEQLHLITDSPQLFDPSLATATLPSLSTPLPPPSLAPSSPVAGGTDTLPEGAAEGSPTPQLEASRGKFACCS